MQDSRIRGIGLIGLGIGQQQTETKWTIGEMTD